MEVLQNPLMEVWAHKKQSAKGAEGKRKNRGSFSKKTKRSTLTPRTPYLSAVRQSRDLLFALVHRNPWTSCEAPRFTCRHLAYLANQNIISQQSLKRQAQALPQPKAGLEVVPKGPLSATGKG